MKKPLHQMIALFLSLLLLIPLTAAPVLAATTSPSFDNFAKVNSYTEGQFLDVPSSAWFAEYVKSSYEIGLFNGTSNNTFSPNNNITVAETITLASRLHSIYMGNTAVFEATTPWYQTYVDYAIENRIIAPEDSMDYPKNATKVQFSYIMSQALPDDALSPINNVTHIPGVGHSIPYFRSIYKLYNAGILRGTDEYGTFSPYSPITRSEAATIVSAMANPTLRKTFTLVPEVIDLQALAYETLYHNIAANYNVTLEGRPAIRIINPNTQNSDTIWIALTPNFNEIEVRQEFVSGKYTFFSQLFLTRIGQNYLFRCGIIHRGGNANVVGTVHIDPHGFRPSTNIFFETFTGTSGSVTPGNQASAQQMAITMLCGSLCRVNNIDTEYFSKELFSIANFGFDEEYFRKTNFTYTYSEN